MHTHKFEPIDLDRLLDNANTFGTWLAILPHNLDPQKTGSGYRFGASQGLSLFRTPQGEIVLHNFSQKLDIPSGNLYRVVCHLYNLQPKGNLDDFRKACQIIANASGQELSINAQTTRYKRKEILPLVATPTDETDSEWIPNAKQELKRSFEFTLGTYQEPLWNGILRYFSKWGITETTLKKYGVAPLRRAKHLKSNFDTNFSNNDIAFVYCVGNQDSTIKAKRPFAKKEKKELKEFYLQNAGNYVFGYRQLPVSGQTLVIAAGEKDTLTINQHLNQFGIYAICYSSESAKINAKHLDSLRARFQQIFVCFDNDHLKPHNTGQINMEKLAIEHGLPFIDIAAFSSEKDISDVFEKEGLEGLKSIFSWETATKTAIAKRPNDVFSIGVANVLRLDVKQYLSEKLDFLKIFIIENQRLMLQSSTGSGKTWAFMKLASQTDFFSENALEHLIFCVPTTAILEQLERDFESECGTHPSVIQGSSTDFDIQAALQSRLILVTYDSLHKVGSIVENALLVIDEFHELRNAYTYREKATQEVFEFAQIAKRSVCISATPLLALTDPKYYPLGGGYRLCKVNCKQVQKIVVQPYIYEEGKEIDVFQHRLQQTNDQNSTHIIKKNNLAMLQTFQDIAQKAGQSFEIFSSKSPEYKSENANYQSIMNNGKLHETKDWLGCTSLFDAGASFRFPVGSVTFINERCTDSFVQHIARARIDKSLNINTKIAVFAYHTTPKDTQNRTFLHQDFTQTLDSFIKFAFDAVDFLTIYHQPNEPDSIEGLRKYQDTTFVYYSRLQQKWTIDFLAILSRLHQIECAESSLEEYYARMEYYNPHITVLPVQKISLAEDINAQQSLREKRQLKKELSEQFHELWQQKNMDSLLEAVWHSTNNSKLKEQIKRTIPISYKEVSADAQKLLDTYPKIFEYEIPQKYLLHFFRLRKFGLPSEICREMVTNHPKQADFVRFYNTLVTQVELHFQQKNPFILSQETNIRLHEYYKIRQTIEELRQQISQNPDLAIHKNQLGIGTKVLTGALKKALRLPHLTFQEAKLKVQELYHLETTRTKRKGKQYVIFVVSQAKTLVELLEKYELKPNDVFWKCCAGHS